MKWPRLKFGWLKRLVKYAFIATSLLFALFVLLAWTGVIERWARTEIISRIERATGGRVELQEFHFAFLALRAELVGFTLHGREPADAPPLFHADHLLVDVRVDSFFRRKFSLDEIRLVRPTIHVAVTPDGQSNLPTPPVAAQPAQPGKPIRERLFDIVTRKFLLQDGELLVNQTRVPLKVESQDFDIGFEYRRNVQGEAEYAGQFVFNEFRLAAKRYAPMASELRGRIVLARESLRIEELLWKLPGSVVTAGVNLRQFGKNDWEFRYAAQMAFADLSTILRMPNFPGGRAQTSGAGRWENGKLSLDGKFTASDIDLPYAWFRAQNVDASGSYHADNKTLSVPDFSARLLGGVIKGSVGLQFTGMKYTTQMRMENVNVARLLDAVNRRTLPVSTFHWDGTMDAEATTTWQNDFQILESRGIANWSPPQELAAGKIPVTARLDYHFARRTETVTLGQSYISTPTSRIEMRGRLGPDSSLAVKLDASDLNPWQDFIQALRGPDSPPLHIAGHAKFDGRVVGALSSPVFSGQASVTNAEYGTMKWDRVEGELSYGPDEFRFERGAARRARSSMTLDAWLGLRDWSFRPESTISISAELVRAPIADLQTFAETKYPVDGILTGQFRVKGTRAQPEVSGFLDVTEVQAAGIKLDRARSQLRISDEEVAVTNVELRKAGGRVTGNLHYRFSDRHIAFDATGAVIPLGQLEPLAKTNPPVKGQLSFQIKGEGPFAAPRAEGTARVVDLTLGEDLIGSFAANLKSDGRLLSAQLTSAMTGGSARGDLEITLAGDYPARGSLSIRQIDLDVFLHRTLGGATAFTEHSRVDGEFKFEAALAKPETLALEGNISGITLAYRTVRIQNEGPIQFALRNQELRITQARLRGPNTDFQASGFARFRGDQRLGLKLEGQVDLLLAGGLLPDLDTRGGARINASIEGTMKSPRINGRVSILDASAGYGDFPARLSHVRGDLVFDAARLTFDNVTAETGSGKVTLTGSVNYGEGPLRYDLNINANTVRLRYPRGMSWLLGGNLRLAGTSEGALLSGRLAIDRLLLTSGVDFGGFMAASQGPATGSSAPGTTTSPFLRNLRFDIEAVTSPGARLEWADGRFDCEAQLRVRGTFDRPILLGSIRLLGGELTFRDNRYTLTRGEIIFSDPFKIDPVLNIEATTTIRQYEIALNLSGKASQLQLSYRSDPPLPANDIIAMLALGRPGDATELRTTGQSNTTPGQGAGQILSEAISSQIGGRIERLFGVSRFRIDPFLAGTGTEQNANARITIEQQITRDLVVTYVTNVSSNQQQVIQVEYAVNRDISIIALRDQNGTFGFDIKFKKRFR